MSDSEFQHILAQARLLKTPSKGLPPLPPAGNPRGEPQLPPSPLTKQGGGRPQKAPDALRSKNGEKTLKIIKNQKAPARLLKLSELGEEAFARAVPPPLSKGTPPAWIRAVISPAGRRKRGRKGKNATKMAAETGIKAPRQQNPPAPGGGRGLPLLRCPPKGTWKGGFWGRS